MKLYEEMLKSVNRSPTVENPLQGVAAEYAMVLSDPPTREELYTIVHKQQLMIAGILGALEAVRRDVKITINELNRRTASQQMVGET